ncbi:MAG: prepilin-type N-terminal cleavage/methylation domain-containing protein [Hydrogenophaga sp.]|uniref:GspH/FimT family pseudopilin n=1 Tax=Hydrogenophaga sp. TaxID=1904254 RepID=UPI0016ABCDA0|nr:GspH/FimT family pseudopilin [Hydrogenophaga sp.]NIM40762.1 prepilin-type N-terminal cleavage/methylation domain-containing protein [Hydrogenophaga sp.]NIN26237.1 prepilin-type N-terminal cleavage/methylation domain-containing protein [Hydrogenophaga sp.]NIN31102.1 prepilin-type N-terminal cleavage/methylation domain-containing protein [Hydrogenophaga sp.]NIN55145.1 prepilin-type N-terminal cleavage/methylation domain-containing protein [Hydrogenophaga sp.]NIO51188.1 prepilin-type N-termina
MKRPADNPGVKHSLTRRPPNRPEARGFSLIELMVTVAVLAIILAIAVPGFQSFIASSRLTTVTNDFVGALTFTRSEAIRRGGRVTLCKSTDGATCTDAGSWQQGWIAFVDVTRAGASAEVDAGETIVAHFNAAPTGMSVVGDAALANFVSFAADGTSRTLAGAAQGGRIRVCTSATALGNDRRARDITITPSGRISSTTPANVDAACPL